MVTPVRVLVADDNLTLRDATVDLLTADPGITVLGTASTAQEAIAQCATLAPDVVLMDVKMPGGGGPKATEGICRRHRQTRVVAFSAHQDQSTVLEMRNAGAVDYVTKGSAPAEIIAAIYNATQVRPCPPLLGGASRG
ncbi:MAG TPA: response regulator transcription factor [Egibacteraceae bacterium]|nr:response regulator transcription factor [Egibacteraceae bacterium]